MTYLYAYTDAAGGEVEIAHSMSEPARTMHEGRPVRRLIAGSREPAQLRYTPGDSSAWSNTGHAKPEAHRHAEMVLGRKLFPPKDG